MRYEVKNVNEFLDAFEKARTSSEKTQIYVKKGEYNIEKTISLPSNVEIIGEEGVYFYGSKRVSIKNAKKSDGLFKLNLKSSGIADSGRFGLGPYKEFWKNYDIPKPHMDDEGPGLEMYFGDKKMNISRYPKVGYMRIKKALGKTEKLFQGEKNGSEEGIFIPSDVEFFKRENTDELHLIGFWNADWATQKHKIKSFDKETGIIEVVEPYHTFGYRDGTCFTGEIGGKFYAINALTEVREPGDWYIDRANDEVYFIPYEGQEYIDIAVCEDLFKAENEKNITIKNIDISRCRRSAFKFNNCEDVHIESCCVKHVGCWGVLLDNCESSSVSHCRVNNTGGGGIACSGGDRNVLKSSKNFVCNNEIHTVACWNKTYSAGVEINGVNVVVSENNIYDVPSLGIVFQGNNHIIEKNKLTNCCCESNDAGAIYAGRDYTCQGTIIRYNHLHNMKGFEDRGCVGIYFDDGMCTAEVYGNVLTNFTYVGILIGGGRNFDVHDNIFSDCKISVMFDDRLDRWASGNKRLVEHLGDVPYRSEIWKNAYPALYNVLDDEPTLPKYNKFYNNTIIGGDGVAMTYEKIEKYFEHFDNKYINRTDKTPYIDHLEDWHYLTDKI